MTDLLTPQRRSLIGERLRRDGSVRAADLAVSFGVSEDTIRRDLRDLAVSGVCRRVYGGALLAAPDEGSFGERRGLAAGRKMALARALSCTIMPNSILFVDAGSTNLAIAAALPPGAGITVVTNAPAIACVLAERGGFEAILLGGRLDAQSGGCLGAQPMRDLQRFRFSALVLGACGVDAEAGLTAHRLEEAELKAAAAERSAAVLVAATNEKLGTAAAFSILPTSRLTALFVEADHPGDLVAPFRVLGIPVTSAEAPAGPVPASLRRPRRAASAA